MARKRPAPRPTPPTPQRVRTAVGKGDFAAAVEQAVTLAAFDPRPESTALLRDTLLKAADHYDQTGRADDLRRVLDTAVKLNHPEPDWVRGITVRLAKAGRRADADALAAPLADPKFGMLLAAHFADWLIRTHAAEAVPAEWQSGYDAVVTGFARYHAGKDDDAREALAAVGLSSPFLEWKLLLRGLIAWTANDDARAVENFSRLSADRLPYRLASPVRVQCDPAFADARPGPERSVLVEQGRGLRANGLVAKLSKVRTELARARRLGPVFKATEAVVPVLQKQAPHLLPKLADALYFVIAKRGEQDDLPRYRKVFGPPPSDPAFAKLEAMVFEEIGELEVALQRWAAFEGWLAGVPAGWSQALADRGRAVVLTRMAGLAADLEEEAADPLAMDDFAGFFGSPARKPKTKRKPPDPTNYLKRAADLAPDWEPAARELFESAREHNNPAAAEAAARRFLAHHPRSIPTLTALATLLAEQGNTSEALELRQRALAVNPLDSANRHAFGVALIAHARRLAVAGDLAAAEHVLDEHRGVTEATVPTSYHALRAAIHRKAKRTAEADAAADAALAQKSARLVARLYLHANAVLLKLKPAEKTVANKAFAAALADPPTPAEATTLLAGWDMYVTEGMKYVGQKAQEKKILDLLLRAVPHPDGTEFEFELLAGVLQNRKQYPLALKAVAALMKRFPRNPLFPLVAAQAELGKSKGRAVYKVTEPLRKAKALAEASPEERHKQLLPQIEDLLKASDPFAGLFGGFFG